MESNDSPEIPDRAETSDIPGLPSGSGFMANRYLGDNVHLIYDLISYLNTTKKQKKNASGLLLCLDFEKAFDSVD